MKKKIISCMFAVISVLLSSTCSICAMSGRVSLKSFSYIISENVRGVDVFCERYSSDEDINELIRKINSFNELDIRVNLIRRNEPIENHDRIAQAIQGRCQGKNITLETSIQEVYSDEEESEVEVMS